MDEELRKHIRIDPLKVQQKIYELYPANSAVRRNAIADAKAKELTHLSSMVHNEPVQMAQASITKNKQLILTSILMCTLLTFLSSAAIMYSFMFAKTTVEAVLSGLIGGHLAFHVFSYIKNILYLKQVTSAFLASLEKIQSRINELRK